MFGYCSNQAAFIDRIVLSVWSNAKPKLNRLPKAKDSGILSQKSLYARLFNGEDPLTGNPVQIKYIKVSPFPRVPPYSMTIRSEKLPLTGAQINELLRLTFPEATRIQPVLVEVPFDLKGTSVGEIEYRMIHRARLYSVLQDPYARRTFYCGSPSSSWQIRVYDKAEDLVRLEVVLRRAYLQKFGIRQPDSLVRLRSLPLDQMFTIRKFSRPNVVAATKNWRDQYWRDAASSWGYFKKSLRLLARMLGKTRSEIDQIFPRSRLQRVVESMQANLIW